MIADLGAFWNGLAGAATGLGGAWILMRELRDQVKSQGAEIKTLRNEKIVGLEERMKSMEVACTHKHEKVGEDMRAVDRIVAELKSISGWLKTVDAKLETVSGTTTQTGAAVEALTTWVGNLNNDYQAHQRDRTIHEVHHA